MNSNLATMRAYAGRTTLLLVFVFSFTFGVSAQLSTPTPASSPQTSPSPKASPTPASERQFFRDILRDQRAIWTSPLRLEGKDARWLVPLGLTTASLIATDRRTARSLHNDRARLRASRGVSYAGSLYTAGALATTSYLIGRWADNPRLRETGLLGAEALANSVMVYSALKEVTQRPRPREDRGRGRFFTGGGSFPSGHATNAWSLATVVAHEYKDHPLARWSAYSIATLVSVSRFTGRNHFLSDVLMGSAIGYGIGRYVYHKHHDPNLDSSNRLEPVRVHSKLWPLIAPRYDRRPRGFGLTLRWNLPL
jgi:membrane-associated phospholipid phosphatase